MSGKQEKSKTTFMRGGIGDYGIHKDKKSEPGYRKADSLVGKTVAVALFSAMIIQAGEFLDRGVEFDAEPETTFVEAQCKVPVWIGENEFSEPQSLGILNFNDLAEDIIRDEVNHLAEYITSKYKIESKKSSEIAEVAFKEAEVQNLDPLLLAAVIAKESSFNEHAVSFLGAKGLMQIFHKWHKNKISKEDIHDPEKNIAVGALILRQYIDQEKGDLAKGLQRYNGARSDQTMKYSKEVFSLYEDLKQETVIEPDAPVSLQKSAPGFKVEVH